MYKCEECEKTFEEPKFTNFGEGKYALCPHCDGDFDKAKACEVCGEYFTESEMPDGVCEDCIEAHKTIDFCIEVGDEEPESVKINSFFTSVYTEEDIDFILEEYYRQHTDKPQMTVDCDEFYKSDCVWFADKIKERG